MAPSGRGPLAAVVASLLALAPAAHAASPPIERVMSGLGNAQSLSPDGLLVADSGAGIRRVPSGSMVAGADVLGAVGVANQLGMGGYLLAYLDGGTAVIRQVDDQGAFTDTSSSQQGLTGLAYDALWGKGFFSSGTARGVFALTGTPPVTSRVAGVAPGPPVPTVSDGASPTSGDVGAPSGVAIDPSDPPTSDANFAFTSNAGTQGLVYLVTGSGTPDAAINIVAGKGTSPGIGDGAFATNASLSNPTSVAFLKSGGYLVYDAGHGRLRRISSSDRATATIDTIAGNGTNGLAADGTPADQAPLAGEGKIAVVDSGILLTQGAFGVVERIPAAAVTGGPPSGFTRERTATFELASWDADALFSCALDDATMDSCDATQQVDGPLADGVHTLAVSAKTDGQNLVSPVVQRSWTVDGTPPAAFGLSTPAAGAVVGATVDFGWAETTDATAGVDHYELWVDGAKSGEGCCGSQLLLADGVHSWEVTAIDKAGNTRLTGSRSFTVSSPPTAALTIAPSRALVNRSVTFDASKSSDANGSITRYEWDLDGDGSFETDTGGAPTVTRAYDRPQTLTASVRVTDSGGLTATAEGELPVSALPPAGKQLGVSINDGAQYTNDPNVTVFAVWPSFASNALVSNDGGFKLGQSFPVAERIAWKLDSSGPERLPKTIYVRFTAGSQVSETYTDDIILDQTPPKVLSAAVGDRAGAARAAAARKVTLKLKAKDNVSGVAAVQVTKSKRRPGKFLKFRKTLKVAPAKKLYVRVRDRAGNLSAWRAAKRR